MSLPTLLPPSATASIWGTSVGLGVHDSHHLRHTMTLASPKAHLNRWHGGEAGVHGCTDIQPSSCCRDFQV